MAAITSNVASGNWSAPGSWSPAQVPAEGDTVTIQNGHTITIDDAAPATIVVGADTTTPAIQIAAGGTLQYLAAAGADHVLQLKGDLKVAGTLSLGTAANPIPAGRKFTIKTNYSASLASGKYGLIIQAGGTFICQGASDRITVDRALLAVDAGGYCNTSGTAVTRLQGQSFLGMSGNIVINGTTYTISSVTDADHLVLTASAGTQTSVSYIPANTTGLTTNVSTGWKSGDKVGIASTSRTYSDCETTALNGDASGTSLTLAAALTRAHIGTSPTQAEVINLTRNVVITAYDTTKVGYVVFETTAQVDVDWTEFSYLGENATDKYGVTIKTTTGSCNLNRCSFHDFEDGGIYVSGSSHNNWTVQNSVGYNLASLTANHAINVSAATSGTAWTLDNNIVMLCAASCYGISLADVGGTCTNNTVVGAAGLGIYVGDANTTIGSLSGNIVHSCGNAALYFSYNPGGTVNNFIAWRNNGAGLQVSGTGQYYSNIILFGNSPNIYLMGQQIDIDNLTANGDVVFSSNWGIQSMAFSPLGCNLTNSNLGTASGIKTNHTSGDLGGSAYSYLALYLFNTTLASTSQVVFPSSGAIKNSFVRATRLNGVSGLAGIKSWFPYGTITPDTTYYKTASPSQRLTPSSASAKLESGKKQFAIASGQTATVTVWVRKSAAYNGNQPRLVLKANPAVGVNSDTIMATMSGGVDVDVGPGNFTQLSGTTPAASQDGVMEVVVDCDGTAGFVNVDLWGFA